MGNYVTPANNYRAFEDAAVITNPKILEEQNAYLEMQKAKENLIRHTRAFKHNVPKHHLDAWPLKDVVRDELYSDSDSSRARGKRGKGHGGSQDELDLPMYTEDSELYALYPNLNQTLDDFKHVVRALKTRLQAEHFPEMNVMLSNQVLAPYTMCEDREQRRLLSYHMAKLGFAKAASAYYIHVMTEERTGKRNGKMLALGDSEGRALLRTMRTVIWQLCGGNYKLAYKFGQAGFIRIVVEDLQDLKPYIKKGGDEMIKYATHSALGILCNCAKGESNKKYYQELNTVERVRPYIHSPDTGIKTAAVLTLTYIVDEVKYPQLLTDESVVSYMMTVLFEAAHHPTRQARGYSAFDLIKGLTILAVNDFNKSLIMKKEISPCLMKLLLAGDTYDREAAGLMVWTLAFDQKNKEQFLGNRELMDLLEQVRSHPNVKRDEKVAIDGAMWVLKGHDNYVERQKKKGGSNTKSRMVMLSYNWADQRVALLIRDALRKANHDVWIDIEHLDKPMPRARVHAINTCTYVIMCLSSKYKQAPVSRTEARFARELSKHILPVAVQRDYRPDGWLQQTIGEARIYDLGCSAAFETNMPELIQDLEALMGVSM